MYQVTIDSLRQDQSEIQQMRVEDAEKHRRELKSLQDRYDALTKFVEVGRHHVVARSSLIGAT